MIQMKNIFHVSFLFVLFALGTSALKAEVIYSIPLEGEEHQIGSLLNWSTSMENNNQVFIVEKSLDGIDFQGIGEIDAVGNSNDENGYRFLDVGVSNENAYYRLRQLDQDGTMSYSQSIMIQKDLTNNFMVMAMSNTRTNSTFTFSVDAMVDDEIYYAVKTKKGEIISEHKQDLYFGINEITVNVEDEVEGTYFVFLKVKDEKEKLVIRKVDDELKKKENVASKKQPNGG